MQAEHPNPQESSSSSKTQNDGSRTKDHGTRSSSENRILEWIDETFEVIVYPTGFENCIVGVGERFGGPPVAVLDMQKMLAQLQKNGMNEDEALEYFEYNILGSYVGEQSPVYMHIPDFKFEKEAADRKGTETK